MKYIIEHMEQGFSEWVTLEYAQIIRDIGAANLILSSLPKGTTETDIPQKLLDMGLQWTTRPLNEINQASFRQLGFIEREKSVSFGS